MTQQNDTLDATFASFFGPSEKTHGTGVATRVIGGELTRVVVDKAENAEFHARQRAEADARNEAEDRLHELMDRLNN